jgi:hypothetical protein
MFTVGQLKKFIEEHNIPDDATIVYQRIEDIYFEGADISGMRGKLPNGEYGVLTPGTKAKGWETIKKEGYWYHKMKELNISEEDLEKSKEEYIEVHSPVLFDKEHLYLTAHY